MQIATAMYLFDWLKTKLAVFSVICGGLIILGGWPVGQENVAPAILADHDHNGKDWQSLMVMCWMT